MAYTEVKTTGPIEWARLFEGNRDMEGYQGAYAACDGAYTVSQILSKEEFTKLQTAGTTKKPVQKRLMDGELVIKFERKHTVTKKDGTVVSQAGGAPVVTDAEGNAWTDEHGLIGNGSVAEVSNLISTFKGQDGKMYARTSLVSVKIIEHVKYEKDAEVAA
jgi:hypothetical protein|tara:strand:- start:85 stop:567 length:483 start_codon:yes stop_codon:yes gene_type:complete